MEQIKGLVFDFHRGTTHDGPGMRTTIFMKGCLLQCKWCQNPEGINANSEIQWTKIKCIGCKTCLNVCQNKAITTDLDGIKVNKESCIGCNKCVANCPSKALECVGKLWDVPSLVKEACKDEIFFEDFNGGITISGGEPLQQYRFVKVVLKELKIKGQNTALDTSGYGKIEAIEELFPYVDTFLYDIKFISESEHVKYTGVSNKIILRNLKWIASHIRDNSCCRLWIRTPLIPDATATENNIRQIGNFIQKELMDITERWELCAFNNVCKDKYKKLNRPWQYMETLLMTNESVNMLASLARKFVGDKLVVSGLTAKS